MINKQSKKWLSKGIITFSVLILLQAGQAKASFFAPTGYEASWVSQSQANTTDQFFHVTPCQTVDFQAVFKNTGTTTWENTGNNQIAFNIYKDSNVISYPKNFSYLAGTKESYFYHSSWLTPFRIGNSTENTVSPGSNATIAMKFQIPCDAQPGYYREDISMAAGSLWMKNTTNGDPLNVAHIWVGFLVDTTATNTDTPVLYIQGPNNTDYIKQKTQLLKNEWFGSDFSLLKSNDNTDTFTQYQLNGIPVDPNPFYDESMFTNMATFNNRKEILLTTIEEASLTNSVYYFNTEGTNYVKELLRFSRDLKGVSYRIPHIEKIYQDNFAEITLYGCWGCGGHLGETILLDIDGYKWTNIGKVLNLEWLQNRTYRYKEAIENKNPQCQGECGLLELYKDPNTLPWKYGSL
ncbi:MAG: hypothetical protein WCP97_03125 [bacterium]